MTTPRESRGAQASIFLAPASVARWAPLQGPVPPWLRGAGVTVSDEENAAADLPSEGVPACVMPKSGGHHAAAQDAGDEAR
jgi:hypothetical protein